MYEISKYKYAALTHHIIGCAMRVHSYFGPGYPEAIYQRAIMMELAAANINAEAEVEAEVRYHGKVIGKRRIDIIVERKVLLELKALAFLESDASNQVLNCLQVFGYEVGLLLNFGKRSLEFKRFARDIK